jgi:RNase P/RNase MRP subunit p29
MLRVRQAFFGAGLFGAAVLLSIGFAAASVSAQDVTFAEGTAVSLVLAKDVSSKTAERGQSVNFTVDEDVTVDGRVIIKKGTPAVGSVIYAEKGGYMGNSGKLAVQVESTTTVDGQPLRLNAAKGSEGKDKYGTMTALSIVAGPFAMLKRGGDTVVKEGTKFTVYAGEGRTFRVEGDTLVAVKTQSPAVSDPNGEKVTLYIYRPKKFVGSALEPSIFVDGTELARMDNGRYFVAKLAPGKHIVHMTDEKKGYELNMNAGFTYYFRVGIEAGAFKGGGKILLEDQDKGSAEVKKLKPLGTDKIKDKTMVLAS